MKEKTGILFIQLSDEITYKFTNKLKERLLSSFPSLVCFDIDNHSESILINYALKFVDLFEKTFVVIQSESETQKISSLNQLFKQLTKKEQVFIVDNSNNKMINLLFRREKKYQKDMSSDDLVKLI